MKTTSTATLAEMDRIVTEPAYLVRIGFFRPWRGSTRGSWDFGDGRYLEADVQVRDLRLSARADQSARLVIGNSDGAMGRQVQDEGIADREIHIWRWYGPLIAEAEPIFSGFGDTFEITTQAVELTANSLSTGVQFAPRRRVTAAAGFSLLPPAGYVVQWDGEVYELVPGEADA